MPTRFYLPSSGTPAISPAFAFWNDTSIATRRELVTIKISSTLTSFSFADSDATDKDILFSQFISSPIVAQTISAQTIQIVVRAREYDANRNLFLAWRINVVSNDGSTLRGGIIPFRRDNTEFSVPSIRSCYDTTTSTEVIAQDGDRIVVEIGAGGDPNAGWDHDCDVQFGDDSGSDCGANDTNTGTSSPWLEFANTLTFLTTNVKTINGLVKSSVKAFNGLAIDAVANINNLI